MEKKKEELNEVLTSKTPIKTWIDDFIASDAPQFAGKSSEERKQMAIAAWYAKHRETKRK